MKNLYSLAQSLKERYPMNVFQERPGNDQSWVNTNGQPLPFKEPKQTPMGGRYMFSSPKACDLCGTPIANAFVKGILDEKYQTHVLGGRFCPACAQKVNKNLPHETYQHQGQEWIRTASCK